MDEMRNVKLVQPFKPLPQVVISHTEPWANRKSVDYEKPYGDDIAMDDFSSSSSRTDSYAGSPRIELGGAENDAYDMERLGKKQEFKRNLSFMHILGFTSIFMATWEDVLM